MQTIKDLSRLLGVIQRVTVVFVLGFASGLPLALTGGSLQAWLTLEGMDLTTIGFLSLIAIPYTFKFLWSPLLDRFEPPFFGRRRGWIFLIQVVMALLLFLMSTISPKESLFQFGIIAVLIAFCSASLDVVIDAYRADLLLPNERGLGSSLSVLGYRIAMILSGGIAMIWAQQWGSWAQVYEVMSYIVLGVGLAAFIFLPKIHSSFTSVDSDPKKELLGFFALLFGILAGYWLSRFGMMLIGININSANDWVKVFVVVVEILASLTLGLFCSRKVGFVTLNASLDSYFSSRSAWLFLALIVLYKLGDAYTVSLTTAFMIRGLGFEQIEVGLANKSIGLIAIILGALVGGLLMFRLKLWIALFVFGFLQLISIGGFYLLAVLGKGAWGSIEIPAFNIFIAKVATATQIDKLMVSAVGFENFASGMGSAALIALMMSLCNKKFSATHFALFSAFATFGRVFVGPFSGVIAKQMGWPSFFIIGIFVALPGVLLILFMRKEINALSEN